MVEKIIQEQIKRTIEGGDQKDENTRKDMG
jgi:hypothetical protein